MVYSINYVKYETQKRLNRIRSYRLHSYCSHLANEFEYMANFIFNSTGNLEIIEYSNAVYYGEVLRGVKHGYGIIIYEDGNFYMGQFRNNERSGEGIRLDNKGNIYKGDFRDNSFNGEGCAYFKDTDIEVDGIFANYDIVKVYGASNNFSYEIEGKGKMVYDSETKTYKEESSGCGSFIVLCIIIFIFFKCCT